MITVPSIADTAAAVRTLSTRQFRHHIRSRRSPLFSPRPLHVSLDGLFISALVRAGLCRKHSTNTAQKVPNITRADPYVPSPQSVPVKTTPPSVRPHLHAIIGALEVKNKGQEGDRIRTKDLRPGLPPAEEIDRGLHESGGVHRAGRPLPHSRRKDTFTTASKPADDIPEKAANNVAMNERPILRAFRYKPCRFVTPHLQRAEPRRTLPALMPKSLEDIESVAALNAAIISTHNTNEELFEVYSRLDNGVGYLAEKPLYWLIKRFMSVPQRNRTAMHRYLSILEDMRRVDLNIYPAEWNQAINFVTRSYAATSRADVDLALAMWEEREAVGIHDDCDAVTGFNILLSAASRASWDRLVHSLLQEISRRNISFNRYTHTTLITYYGYKKDVTSISAAYKRMVDAGEIIDTVVLNCIMSALIKAWKFPLAKHIFDWMLEHRTPAPPFIPTDFRTQTRAYLPHTPVLDWRQKRHNAKTLLAATALKSYTSNLQVSLSPDMTTYHLILSHYCEFGYYTEAASILALQTEAGIPWFKHTFVTLLKAFAWHGDRHPDPHNDWNKARLLDIIEQLFAAWERTPKGGLPRYEDTIDGGQTLDGSRFEWDKNAVIWVLKASAKVFGEPEALEEFWNRMEAQVKVQTGEMWEPARATYDRLAAEAWNRKAEEHGRRRRF